MNRYKQYKQYYEEVTKLKKTIEKENTYPDFGGSQLTEVPICEELVGISLRFPKRDILEILGFMELYFKGAADWESEQNQKIE